MKAIPGLGGLEVVGGAVVGPGGHACVLQASVSSAPCANGHAVPPFAAARLTAYCRACWPPPHGLEHADHSPHWPSQLTATRERAAQQTR